MDLRPQSIKYISVYAHHISLYRSRWPTHLPTLIYQIWLPSYKKIISSESRFVAERYLTADEIVVTTGRDELPINPLSSSQVLNFCQIGTVNVTMRRIFQNFNYSKKKNSNLFPNQNAEENLKKNKKLSNWQIMLNKWDRVIREVTCGLKMTLNVGVWFIAYLVSSLCSYMYAKYKKEM